VLSSSYKKLPLFLLLSLFSIYLLPACLKPCSFIHFTNPPCKTQKPEKDNRKDNFWILTVFSYPFLILKRIRISFQTPSIHPLFSLAEPRNDFIYRGSYSTGELFLCQVAAQTVSQLRHWQEKRQGNSRGMKANTSTSSNETGRWEN
jgi:hypothetical protein